MAIKNSVDIALLLLRLTFGGLMIYGHGWGKMLRLFGDGEIRFADPFGLGPVASLALAVFAEVLCAFLITIGLFTRWAVIPLIVTMLVAFLVVHIDDPFNKMEKALLYLIPYVAIWLAGPGKYSIDQLFLKK